MPAEDAAVPESRGYQAPMIERLGTLAELTQGGAAITIDDGIGGAGDIGASL
jgi:hypothetical protein